MQSQHITHSHSFLETILYIISIFPKYKYASVFQGDISQGTRWIQRVEIQSSRGPLNSEINYEGVKHRLHISTFYPLTSPRSFHAERHLLSSEIGIRNAQRIFSFSPLEKR